MGGRERRGVDHAVPLPLRQLAQVIGVGAIPVERFCAGAWMTAQPAGKRRDVVATADRVIHDGPSEETCSPEH